MNSKRHTPLRSIRIDDQLWNAAVATVGERGVSEAIREALADLVADGLNDRPKATRLIPLPATGRWLDPVTVRVNDAGVIECRTYRRNGRRSTGWAARSEPHTLTAGTLATLQRAYPEAFPNIATATTERKTTK